MNNFIVISNDDFQEFDLLWDLAEKTEKRLVAYSVRLESNYYYDDTFCGTLEECKDFIAWQGLLNDDENDVRIALIGLDELCRECWTYEEYTKEELKGL